MTTLRQIQSEIRKAGNSEKAVLLQRFFKTGEGEYGYGDVFLGLTVPQSRKIAVAYKDLPLSDVETLLESKYHEERLIALLLLVHNFKTGDEKIRKDIYDFYLSHTKCINNWDLVDLSAEYIVGEYLYSSSGALVESRSQSSLPASPAGRRASLGRTIKVLIDFVHSDNLWERRIAIIATFAFIKKGRYQETFEVAELLLHDKEDLIHKAVGWMLREVGKRVSQDREEDFLKIHYKTMPRTMLRYAIERFPEPRRKQYLSGTIATVNK